MSGRVVFSIVVMGMILSGCVSSTLPKDVNDSRELSTRIVQAGGSAYLAEEYEDFARLLGEGELMVKEGRIEDSAPLFTLARLKGELLLERIPQEKRRLGQVAREEALLRQEKVAGEEQRSARAKEQAGDALPAIESVRRQSREKAPVAFYTVRKGDDLAAISARPDIFHDPSLWPLIYRANRDQVNDPRRLSDGQVLRIPRNLSREEFSEARRYARKTPLF